MSHWPRYCCSAPSSILSVKGRRVSNPSIMLAPAFAFSSCRSIGTTNFSNVNASWTCRRLAKLAPAKKTRHSARNEAGKRPVTCEWVEHSATIPIEASADELFVYYSDLENLPKWFVLAMPSNWRLLTPFTTTWIGMSPPETPHHWPCMPSCACLTLSCRRSPWVKDVALDPRNPLLSEWTLAARGLTFKWSARK